MKITRLVGSAGFMLLGATIIGGEAAVKAVKATPRAVKATPGVVKHAARACEIRGRQVTVKKIVVQTTITKEEADARAAC